MGANGEPTDFPSGPTSSANPTTWPSAAATPGTARTRASVDPAIGGADEKAAFPPVTADRAWTTTATSWLPWSIRPDSEAWMVSVST